jgi:AcrR family transcriptional regulator
MFGDLKKLEKAPSPRRETYRHGDLRRALLEAGLALAREGGPEAVVLREATRRAGVVPNAAYRHFASRDDLLDAVRDAALAKVAEAIESEIARVDPGLSPPDLARAHLRAVGIGYLDFADAEPGLFRAAFTVTATPTNLEASRGPQGLDPFRHLGVALDRMVEAGLLPRERRPGAEILAWSSVHGFAILVNEGPLRRLPTRERRAIAERLVAMVERGL